MTQYDFIILGSGLVESILACMLSKKGKKVIIIDKNGVFGADLATLTYSELEEYFNTGNHDPMLLKLARQFCIDLTPKLHLVDSMLVKMIIKYGIDEYLTFVSIPGSFIFKKKLHSVPTNEAQSLKTNIIGIWQKPKVMKFFWDVRSYAKTLLSGGSYDFKKTMREEFDRYGLSEETREFIGHAIALNLNDDYLDRHPKETFDRICMYVKSIVSYEGSLDSPYMYPKYGNSEIIQGFVRTACLHGAEIMLNAKDIEVDTERCVIKVREPVNNQMVEFSSKKIISGVNYIETGKSHYEVIRCICIVEDGDGEIVSKASSSNIIFLKGDLMRKNDIFVVILGKQEEAAPDGYKVAIISTIKETSNPEKEIEPVISKLGVIKRKYVEIRKVYTADNNFENVIFTNGVDESTHFENFISEIYKISKLLGLDVDLEIENKI